MSTLQERLAEAMAPPCTVTAADLARACGIKPPSVHEWLHGPTKTLKGENAVRVAQELNVNVEWLTTGRGPMRKNTRESSGNEAPVPGDSIDALRYAVSALVSVMIDHRPREGADMARALRRHVPPRLARDGFVSELLKVLDAAQAQSSGLPSRPKR